MIEIKFRGKRMDTLEWIYGNLLTPVGMCTSYEISDHNTVDGSRYEVYKKTIGQYIGIKDINNKEIYEGDIVKLKGRSIELLGEICYNEDDCAFELYDPIAGCYELMFYEGQEYEIIGNRYDNPELFEE